MAGRVDQTWQVGIGPDHRKSVGSPGTEPVPRFHLGSVSQSWDRLGCGAQESCPSFQGRALREADFLRRGAYPNQSTLAVAPWDQVAGFGFQRCAHHRGLQGERDHLPFDWAHRERSGKPGQSTAPCASCQQDDICGMLRAILRVYPTDATGGGDKRARGSTWEDDAAGSGRIIAPMHGLLLEVRVKAGDRVESGQTLAILEAMKMHYEIAADAAGEVIEVLAVAGQQVAVDDLLIDIDTAENH